MHVKLLNIIFDTLNHTTCYVVLRNYELLPDDYGNDVDILVHQESYGIAKNIVLGACRALNLKVLRITTRYAYTGIYIDLGDKFLLIDIYSDLLKGWIRYANPQFVLDNRIRYKNFYVPIVEHEAAIVACKDICAYGKIREKNLPLLLRARKCEEKVFLKLIEEYMRPGYPIKVFKAVRSADIKSNFKLGFKLILYCNFLAAVRWACYRLRNL